MIEIKNVTKFFKTDNKIKYILKDVTLTIPDGVNLGILGKNGAGKSTLLKMLGGIDFPNYGSITSNNSFSWPMGLSGGFQPSMTGRQNVKFVCRIYGKSASQIKDIIKSVQDFAEIDDYFDMPIKDYSSGMKSRLSFGLSLAFDFEYLIIDEVLSVGDARFKNKATNALNAKIKTSKILLVSHSMSILRELCDSGIVVDDGNIYYYDDINDAIQKYEDINAMLPSHEQDKALPKQIYSSDGEIFNNITELAKFYKMRPISFTQAFNENSGSHIYLKKVFWRSGEKEHNFQEWPNIIKNETIISSDGVIFKNELEASLFYIDRVPAAKIEKTHVSEVMQTETKTSKELNIKFYYLSEYS